MCDGTGEDPYSDFKVGIIFLQIRKNCPGAKGAWYQLKVWLKLKKNFFWMS